MKIKDIDNNIEDVDFIGQYCYNISFKHFIDTDSSNFYFSKTGENFKGPHKCFQGRPYICLTKYIPTVSVKADKSSEYTLGDPYNKQVKVIREIGVYCKHTEIIDVKLGD
jgi:hypothetical protein